MLCEKFLDQISNNSVKKIYQLIRDGPAARNLQYLNLDGTLFNLSIVDDHSETQELSTAEREKLINAQKMAEERQTINTLEDFQFLLRNYAAFVKLNRQTVADGKEIWKLKIDPSALKNIDREILQLLLQRIEENTLFYRYFELPILPFLERYARQTGQNDDTLRQLIVSIAFSTECLLTAPPDAKNMISFHRVRKKEEFKNIELGKQRRDALIMAFDEARIIYKYSCFYPKSMHSTRFTSLRTRLRNIHICRSRSCNKYPE